MAKRPAGIARKERGQLLVTGRELDGDKCGVGNIAGCVGGLWQGTSKWEGYMVRRYRTWGMA